MDLSWGAIAKVMLAGLGTYILLPAFLVLRDAVLWMAINKYILTGDLQGKVRRYAELQHKWNTEYAGKVNISSSEEGVTYTFKGQNISVEQWQQHSKSSELVRSELRDLKLNIDRKAKFLKWLLKHYQQEAVDPINEWKKQEDERLQRMFSENS